MKDFEQEQPKRKPKDDDKVKIYKDGVYCYRLESQLQKYFDEGWTVAE